MEKSPGVPHQGVCGRPPERWSLNRVPFSKHYSMATSLWLSKPHWPLRNSPTVHGGVQHVTCSMSQAELRLSLDLLSGLWVPHTPSRGPPTQCRHESGALEIEGPQVGT